MLYFRSSIFSLFTAGLLLLLSSCSAPSAFSGFSYDPEGVEDTSGREVVPQHERTIGFRSDDVWFSNEYPGARMNDTYRLGPNRYRIVIEPENAPINNSPWYGFSVWSGEPVEIEVELVYRHGAQRYTPWLSRDGLEWVRADSSSFETPEEGVGLLRMEVSADPTRVSAQEVHSTLEFSDWLNRFQQRPFVQTSTAGYTHGGRPVKGVRIIEPFGHDQKGVVLVIGRQHPPEVPGYLAGLWFLEELASDSELAREFRRRFEVWSLPMINPDGVDGGHWRHNEGGIDLNRDWEPFHQPETRTARDMFLPLLDRPNRRVYYAIDFHSTDSNIFYPIERSYSTFPRHFTYRWAERIVREFPELELQVLPFDTSAPIAKNWVYKTFGADAVTFEVSDTIDRGLNRRFAVRAARIFMEMMIDEHRSVNGEATSAVHEGDE
ncbi:MAG: M14 family metallopeptidase [Balneolaceae bacterium]